MKILTKFYFFTIQLFRIIHNRIISKLHFKKEYDKLNHDYKLGKSFRNWFSHEMMLSDINRVNTYQSAINKYINPDSTVLDLGTGTGILSFFAAEAGAEKIYAVERTEIIETAKLLAQKNGFSNIEFIHSDSRKIKIQNKIDIIIQEQMGNLLFQENMIEIVLDIRDRFLKKGGKILPNKFRFYIEPVQLLDELNIPFLWEYKFNNIDYYSLKYLDSNLNHLHYFRWIRPNDVKYILTEPTPLIEFDLETLQKNDISLHYKFNRIVQHAGRFDAICLFFDAIFDDQILLSTNPENVDFPNSWVNVIYRVESEFFPKNSEISYALDIGTLEDLQTWEFTRL